MSDQLMNYEYEDRNSIFFAVVEYFTDSVTYKEYEFEFFMKKLIMKKELILIWSMSSYTEFPYGP